MPCPLPRHASSVRGAHRGERPRTTRTRVLTTTCLPRRARSSACVPRRGTERYMTQVKRMLTSADPQEVRVAIVEGGKLSEAYIERRGRRSIVGNIYKGRVDAVLPGMEAAFVDIGLPKNGFLYVAEIVLPELDDRDRRSKRIQELIQSGQDVLVQVTKDPMGSKGARLTMDVSLAGRFMVLAPGGDGVGVSKKPEGPERDRLRDLLRKIIFLMIRRPPRSTLFPYASLFAVTVGALSLRTRGVY